MKKIIYLLCFLSITTCYSQDIPEKYLNILKTSDLKIGQKLSKIKYTSPTSEHTNKFFPIKITYSVINDQDKSNNLFFNVDSNNKVEAIIFEIEKYDEIKHYLDLTKSNQAKSSELSNKEFSISKSHFYKYEKYSIIIQKIGLLNTLIIFDCETTKLLDL